MWNLFVCIALLEAMSLAMFYDFNRMIRGLRHGPKSSKLVALKASSKRLFFLKLVSIYVMAWVMFNPTNAYHRNGIPSITLAVMLGSIAFYFALGIYKNKRALKKVSLPHAVLHTA